MRITLGVTGGVAAYRLRNSYADCNRMDSPPVVMTRGAQGLLLRSHLPP
jgi:hypothetical protein